MIAMCFARPAIVTALLESGADPMRRDEAIGNDAFHLVRLVCCKHVRASPDTGSICKPLTRPHNTQHRRRALPDASTT